MANDMMMIGAVLIIPRVGHRSPGRMPSVIASRENVQDRSALTAIIGRPPTRAMALKKSQLSSYGPLSWARPFLPGTISTRPPSLRQVIKHGDSRYQEREPVSTRKGCIVVAMLMVINPVFT